MILTGHGAMAEKEMSEKKYPAPGSEHILEVISSAFSGQEIEYHKLFLFDRLTRGEKNWHFLIVTRNAGQGRLELAAFSYQLGPHGELQTTLESRKARIPARSLAEVIDSLLIRLDEIDIDFREISLAHLGQAPSKLEYLRLLLGKEPDG